MSTTNYSEEAFPLSNENELKVLVAWSETEMGFKELLEILITKFFELTVPTANIEDRLKNFNFTKIDGNIYNNPLAEIILFRILYSQFKKIGDDDEAKRMLNKMVTPFNKLVGYCNESEETISITIGENGVP
jgi:hypothetical protein